MAITKVINVDVNTGDANAELQKLEGNFKEVDKAAAKTNQSVDDVAGNGGAIAILDQLTGGLATRFKDAFEASKLFNVSLRGMKTALIATGIGALVVALGLVFVYWEDIVDLIKGANRELEAQLVLHDKNITALESELLTLNKIIELETKRGSNLDDLNKKKETELRNLRAAAWFAAEDEKRLIKKLKLTAMQADVFDKINARSGFINEEEQKAIDDATAKLEEYKRKIIEIDILLTPDKIDPKIDPKDVIPEKESEIGFDDTAAKRLELEIIALKELARIRQEFGDKNRDNELVQSGLDRERKLSEIEGLVTDEVFKRQAIAEVNKFYDDQDDEIEQKRRDKKKADDEKAAEEEKRIAKDVASAKLSIRNAELDNVSNGIGLLASLDKKSKLLQASALIAENAVGIAKTVINTAAAAPIISLKYAAIPGGPAFAAAEIAAGKVAAGISIATSVAATAKGLQSLGGAGGGGRGASNTSLGGQTPSAPSFNLIEGTEGNQINESINLQNQEPIQAYVVSGDVTTAQNLDDSIISESGL